MNPEMLKLLTTRTLAVLYADLEHEPEAQEAGWLDAISRHVTEGGWPIERFHRLVEEVRAA